MAYERIKPEHAGAKNGGGAWMTRAEAKQTAKRRRRQVDNWAVRESLHDAPMSDAKIRLVSVSVISGYAGRRPSRDARETCG